MYDSSLNYAVILAGGRGERFWPLSRTSRPKQFVEIFGGVPLLRIAAERLAGVVPPERVLVITSADLVGRSREALPEIPPENIVGEPFGRDTAAACALGTELVAALVRRQSRCADPARARVAILTADQLMADVPAFRRTLANAFFFADAQPVIVTMGITPTRISTAFGYIEADAPIVKGVPEGTSFRKAVRFVEKPDAETAAMYLATGRYFWNAGMFIWSVATFRDALVRYRPQLADAMSALVPSIGTPEFAPALARVYGGLEKISVDYAIMEHATNIVMAEGDFGWDDVGSWTALADHFPADASGNVALGKAEILDGRDNIVVGDDGHVVALFGVDDLVVVHTPDATLVCPKSRAQRLKDLVRRLQDSQPGVVE